MKNSICISTQLANHPLPVIAGATLATTNRTNFMCAFIGHIGTGRTANITIKKDGITEFFNCKSDETGKCYELLYHNNVKMTGNLLCQIEFFKSKYDCSVNFRRTTKILFLPYEYLAGI